MFLLAFAGKGRGLFEFCGYPHLLKTCDGEVRYQAQEPVSSENCPYAYGIFPHKTSCAKYWQCWNGTASEQVGFIVFRLSSLPFGLPKIGERIIWWSLITDVWFFTSKISAWMTLCDNRIFTFSYFSSLHVLLEMWLPTVVQRRDLQLWLPIEREGLPEAPWVSQFVTDCKFNENEPFL